MGGVLCQQWEVEGKGWMGRMESQGTGRETESDGKHRIKGEAVQFFSRF